MIPVNGRLLVIDRQLKEPLDVMSGFYDRRVLRQIDGRERTEAELRSLLADAGLQMRRVIIPIESPLFPLRPIEARPS